LRLGRLGRDGDPDSAAAIEKAFAEGGNTGLQQMRLQRLEMEAKKGYVSPIAMGMAYGRLRDKKKTLEWLEKAYEEHSPTLVRMWMESEWKWLHGDEDFWGADEESWIGAACGLIIESAILDRMSH